MSRRTPSRRSVLALLGSVAGAAGLGALARSRDPTLAGSSSALAPAVEWLHTYPGEADGYVLRGREGQGVVQTADGGYVLGAEGRRVSESGSDSERRFALVRTDSAGQLEWARLVDDGIDNTEQNVRDLAKTGDGGYVLVGEARPGDGDGSPFTGERKQAAEVIATDADGSRRWARVYEVPGERNDEAQYDAAYYESHFASVDRTADGAHVLGGRDSGYEWLVKLGRDGEERWQGHYDTQDGDEYGAVASVAGTRDGGAVYVAGTSLVKVDADGTVEWTTDAGGSVGVPAFSDVVQTADGGYAVTGTGPADDSSDFHLATFDADGDARWHRRYDGPHGGRDASSRLVHTADGGFAVAGRMRTGKTGRSALAVLKVASDGTEHWAVLVEDADAWAADLIRTTDGGFVVAGLARAGESDDDPREPVLAKVTSREEGADGAETSQLRAGESPNGTAARGSTDAAGGTGVAASEPIATASPSSGRTSSRGTHASATPDGDQEADRTTGAGGPGFGVVAALAALLAAAFGRGR